MRIISVLQNFSPWRIKNEMLLDFLEYMESLAGRKTLLMLSK